MKQEDRDELKRLLFDYRRYVVTDDRVVQFVDRLLREARLVPAWTEYDDAGQNVEDKRSGHDTPAA